MQWSGTMKMRELTRSLWFAALLAGSATVWADDMSGMDGLPEYEPGKAWEEQEIPIPPYPESNQGLISLDTNFPGYRYYIDPDSVTVGREDQVARYTVVVEADDGARNVLYEGIRCDIGQYKTYAYGTGKGPFHAMPGAKWKEIRSGDAFRYRRDLLEFYACEGSVVRFDPDRIVQRIQYPPSVHDSTNAP